jgi:effector-binding domain-containing protein
MPGRFADGSRTELILQRILYALLALFALIVLAGFALPRFARVEATLLVDAPASVVFAQANDFHRLALWAPLDEGDPDARIAYAGPARGAEATVSWNGPIVGGGRQRIVESVPYEYVSYLINAGEPGEAVSWIAIEGVAGGTRVTRGFEHDYGYNLVGRYFGVLWTGMVRRDYRQSLERLQALVEDLPRTDFSDIRITEAFNESRPIAYKSVLTAPLPDAASAALGKAYVDILGFIEQAGLDENGPPMAILRGPVGNRQRLDAAIPIVFDTDVVPETERGVQLGRTYEGSVIRVTHTGPYDGLGLAHRKIASYLAATGLERNGDPWEIYVSDPTRTPAAERVTEIVYPVLIY